MARTSATLLVWSALLVGLSSLPGCALCWPRGGAPARCAADDDDATADDDDATADDDDATADDDDSGDDDDATPPPGCTPGTTRAVVVGAGSFEATCIGPGSFMMGSEKSRTDPDERPVHEVILTRTIELARTELTQGFFEAVVPGGDPSNCDENRCASDIHPVQTISWNQSIDFCNTLSTTLGLQPAYTWVGDFPLFDPDADGWRLPTEAEWERAARADEGWAYSGSADWDEVGYCDEWSDDGPLPVGLKLANAWGFLDMSGNVSEWVWDVRDDYPDGPVTDPVGGAPGGAITFRIARSGFFYGPWTTCRVASRGFDTATGRNFGRGLRLARTVPAGQ